MGARGTVVLALLALALGVLVWMERPPREAARSADLLGDSTKRGPAPTLRPLLAFTPADVAAVRLERGGRVAEAERQPTGWVKTQPPNVIEDFLHNLTQLGVLDDIPAGSGDLQEYGLAPPQGTLQLRLRDRAAPLLLQLGNRNPATTGVYVRVGDTGPVVLAGALVEWEFEKAFKALAQSGS